MSDALVMKARLSLLGLAAVTLSACSGEVSGNSARSQDGITLEDLTALIQQDQPSVVSPSGRIAVARAPNDQGMAFAYLVDESGTHIPRQLPLNDMAVAVVEITGCDLPQRYALGGVTSREAVVRFFPIICP